MRQFILTLLIACLSGSMIYGQGVIRGKISDEKGEPLTGATVYVKNNQTVGTITDFDGNYSLKVPSGEVTILISFISYVTMEETMQVNPGEVEIFNAVMQPATTQIEDVVITRKIERSNDMYMQLQKAKSPVSLDYISSETIKQTGDSDIHDATKRITGVSTVGDFITVRGLADRYIKTTINGSRIPTLDPFTNNIELDIFPTSLVDNIVISKTMSPEIPGDWSGAFLSIETKDYPERLTVNVSSSFGYNAQTTFKNYITSKAGPMDWLGMDGGYRNIDNPDWKTFPDYTMNPSPYEQFRALGLDLYLQGLHVDPSLIFDSPGNIYFNLSLVELDILPPALLYDPVAIQQARETYYNSEYVDAFRTINAGLVEFSEKLPANMNNIIATAPFDHSQEFSIGNQVNLFGNPLGFLVGFRYYRSVEYDPNALYNRGQVSNDVLFANDSLAQQASSLSHGWSSLLHLAYKINPNNSISVMFMPNFSGVNRARQGSGILDGAESDATTFTQSHLYEHRRQLVYQAKTDHYIPSVKMRIETSGSLAKGQSNTPDFKRMNWIRYYEEQDTLFAFDNVGLPRRNFRNLREDIYEGQIHAEIPVLSKPNRAGKIKFGATYQENSRSYEQYEYALNQHNIGFRIEDGNLNNYFREENFRVFDQGKYSFIPLHYKVDQSLQLQGRNFSNGYTNVAAGYIMTDYNLTERFRVTGGLRVEHTDLFSDMDLLMGEPRNSPDRELVGAGNLVANYSQIDTIHYLPSINLIYQVAANENITVNARANYSKSLARPSIREVTYSYVYDYEYRIHVLGNPDLKIVDIRNFDLRFESFFKGGDALSLSFFYKDFTNHIEIIEENAYYTWTNTDDSRVYGMELEGKTSFLQSLEFRGNLTLINSQTRIDLAGPGQVEQAMFGQAPYVVNGLLSYQSERLGISASIGYNIQGPRIAVINNEPIPNVVEMPRNLLDFKLGKSLGEFFNISLKIRNLLNAPATRVYEGTDLIYDEYTYGTDYRVSLSYNLN